MAMAMYCIFAARLLKDDDNTTTKFERSNLTASWDDTSQLLLLSMSVSLLLSSHPLSLSLTFVWIPTLLFPTKRKGKSPSFSAFFIGWLREREKQDKGRLICRLQGSLSLSLSLSLSRWATGFVSMAQHADIPEALKPKDDFDSPVHSSTDSRQQKYGDRHNSNDPLRRVSRTSGGSDRSVEQSPLHRNQAKSSLERKGASEGHGVAPSTPGRFKTRGGGRGDESPDKGPAVPKFGEWDESNPSSADGFTHIFNKVREEKQTGSAKVPHITDDSVYLNSYGHGSGSYKSSGCWCFSWRKK